VFELVLAIVLVVLTLLAVSAIGFALVGFFGRDQERADDEAQREAYAHYRSRHHHDQGAG
jgi:hypothetical protein